MPNSLLHNLKKNINVRNVSKLKAQCSKTIYLLQIQLILDTNKILFPQYQCKIQ